jgi:hypothetical protein
MELTKEQKLLISRALLTFKEVFDHEDINYFVKYGVLHKRNEYYLSELDLTDMIQDLRGKL